MFVDATWERVMGYAANDVMGKATHDFFSCTSCALIEAISLNIKEVCTYSCYYCGGFLYTSLKSS
jgi:hypothetical protein